MTEPARVAVLLDTDIGTDVDDAVCLAYLLAHPQCELVGITTVTGEPEKRAALASVVCQAAGVEVPIYPGAGQPLRAPQRQTVAQQAAVLPRWPHQDRFPPGQAVDFMRRVIRSRPGEIVLLTVGPLTNAAQLFTADPEIPGLLKGLVMMGGNFSDPSRVEWNAAGDPHATEIVYQARPPLHRSLGIDVTQQVMLTADEVRLRFTAAWLRPVLDMAEIWFTGFFPSITFHDPLAAATLFLPSLCSYAAGRVTVALDDPPGRTLWQPGAPGSPPLEAPHQVAVNVDVERYFEHFFNILLGG